jgi:hypothetical protein
MEEAFEEGQGPHRAVEPVMMMIAFQCGIHLSSLVTYNVYVYRD